MKFVIKSHTSGKSIDYLIVKDITDILSMDAGRKSLNFVK